MMPSEPGYSEQKNEPFHLSLGGGETDFGLGLFPDSCGQERGAASGSRVQPLLLLTSEI